MKIREDQKTEFKQSWMESNLKSVCAFANTDGGKLYVGLDDNGNVIGIQNSKARIEDIPNIIRSKMDLLVSLIARNEDGKDYLEIIVPKMEHPVFIDGRVYIRVGLINQLVEGSNLIEFLLRKGAGAWDAVIEPNVSIDDLDEESFKILLDGGIMNKRLTEYDRKLSRRELLEKMSLMRDGKLTRAAVLLFHPHPEYFYGGAHIKLGYFDENNSLRYQDELYGSLLSLAKKAEELLVLKYFYATIDYKGFVRAETLPYPREAVREGILNALMHNNYMIAQPIAIRVSPKEMWITNRCLFPSGWTEETLFNTHESKQLNPNIAVGFFRAGLVERFGSGIQKIVDYCKENGNPRPQYLIQPDMLTLKIESRPENIELALGHRPSIIDCGTNTGVVGVAPGNEGVAPGNEGVNLGSEGVPSEPEIKKNKPFIRRKSILQLIKETDSITTSTLSKVLSCSDATIERDLTWLRKNGYIIRNGSDKSGRWLIIKELKKDE